MPTHKLPLIQNILKTVAILFVAIVPLLAFGFNPTSALAQGEDPCTPGQNGGGINLSSCLKLSDDSLVSEVYNNPAVLVNLLVRNIFLLAGIILFLLIIFAGYKLIMGGKQGMEEAKKIATSAVAGFLIMFSAYWIVQLITLLTGVNIPL